jgi:dolichol kinase
LAWADTLAEVVGSFFGKNEFAVSGFGEVNKKTWEGVIATFVASAGVLYLFLFDAGLQHATLGDRFGPEMWAFPMWVVVVVGAVRRKEKESDRCFYG